MGARFWIQRFFLVFVGAFFVIALAQFLKRHDAFYAIEDGLVWAGITATVFVAARIYQSRKGQHCAICKDTPEVQQGNSVRSE